MVMSLENSMISRSRARSTLSPHQSQQPQTGTSPEHAGALGGNQVGWAMSSQAPCDAARILAFRRPGLTWPARPDLQASPKRREVKTWVALKSHNPIGDAASQQ